MSLFDNKYNHYIQFFRFILKYWNSDVFAAADGDLEVLEKKETDEWDKSPKELVDDLKEMGPTYIKLGQLLSTRPDMLPEPYLEALAELQDDVPPVPFEEIEQIFEDEVGESLHTVFATFDREPMASASVGQVHTAILKTGEKVAVKIQRPNIKEQFIKDLDVLMTLTEKAEKYSEDARKFSLRDTVEELQYILLQELNYKKEAQNLRMLKRNLKDFKLLHVPNVFGDYSTQKVLVMEFIEGQKITSLNQEQLAKLPRKKMVDEFVKGYLKQIIVDGFAHADPHPGNIHVTTDGKVALMDLGMVARFGENMKEDILKLMIGLGSNDGDQVTKVLLNMSTYDDSEVDLKAFEKQIVRKMQENKNSDAQDLQTGRSLMDINKAAAQLEIKLPVELISLGKILLNIDQIIAFLSPNHKLQETVRSYTEQLMRSHMLDRMRSGSVLQSMLESKDLMMELPYRVNKITDDLASNRFKINIDAFDEQRFILALQKVANRISTALVIAALILGAALIMRIQTGWKLFGYPGFAVLLFIFAAFMGIYLVYQMLFKDEEE